MNRFFGGVVKHRKLIMILFLLSAVVCFFAWQRVGVNYDMNDYLPDSAQSTVSLDKMREEFSGDIPNARVMINDVTVPQALEFKEQLEAVDGVSDVLWLDDSVDVTVPFSMLDGDTVESYYKDGSALFTVTIEKQKRIEAVDAIRELIGDSGSMSGSAVSTATATTSTVAEISKITVIAVIFVLLVLLLTTSSWLEPLVVLLGLGVAILINNGTNLIFGEISFVTNAAGSILQLAVSLDYSVFLIHRFEECREGEADAERAMTQALSLSATSILSSGLTTVIGFLALILMQFRIGPDLGLALAKGTAVSLLTVFLFTPSLVLMTYRALEKTRHKPLYPSFGGFGRFVSRVSLPLVCVFALLVVPAYLASGSNSYYYGASHIFGTDTRLGSDTEKIESVFGQGDTYVLMVSLLLTASLVGTLALPASAAEQSTPKDEIIYANLTASGERKDVTVVNSFVLDGDGNTKIVDFGDYSSVRNMTTTDELSISGGRITVDTAADRLSYEGTLPDAELPWSITVRYYLDGSDKQLLYIILPGKGADISVEAEVRDFEMDSIAINGVRLSISMSVDDDKLQSVIDELTDATSSLSDGSRELEDGIGSLGSGAAQLGTGASQLRSGADELASGAASLADGLGVISGGSGQLVDGAYAAFEGLCSASAASINAQLSANGLGEVTLTPENYADVLDGIIASLGADKVYEQARAAALAQVTAAVEAQADELHAGYIAQNRDAIIDAYILSISDELYTYAARRAVAQQLAAAGMSEEQIAAYLQTVEGQAQIELVRSSLSDEQKAQICASAAASLSDELQTQILAAAQASLSDEQNKQLRDGYIEQQMAGEEVTAAITQAVESANAAAGGVAQLRGGLDSYAVFYSGLREYTAAVDSASAGAAELSIGAIELDKGAVELESATRSLISGADGLKAGAHELSDGTAELDSRSAELTSKLDSEIDSVIDEALGREVETGSFVSEKNTDVRAVQFVIKTEAVKTAHTDAAEPEAEPELNFWQKLLKLFGLY